MRKSILVEWIFENVRYRIIESVRIKSDKDEFNLKAIVEPDRIITFRLCTIKLSENDVSEMLLRELELNNNFSVDFNATNKVVTIDISTRSSFRR